MDEKIIDIKGVSKSFSGKSVLKDINLYIRKGEFLTLLGPMRDPSFSTARKWATFLPI